MGKIYKVFRDDIWGSGENVKYFDNLLKAENYLRSLVDRFKGRVEVLEEKDIPEYGRCKEDTWTDGLIKNVNVYYRVEEHEVIQLASSDGSEEMVKRNLSDTEKYVSFWEANDFKICELELE
jgi:hypothetical protein